MLWVCVCIFTLATRTTIAIYMHMRMYVNPLCKLPSTLKESHNGDDDDDHHNNNNNNNLEFMHTFLYKRDKEYFVEIKN